MTIVNSSLEKDVQTVEHVRGKWCELLSNDYTGRLSMLLIIGVDFWGAAQTRAPNN